MYDLNHNVMVMSHSLDNDKTIKELSNEITRETLYAEYKNKELFEKEV